VLTDNIDDLIVLTTKPCEELLALSVNRWNSNQWKYFMNGPDNEPTISGFGNCKDDVCVGVMDIVPV
jgi:hypothetical protein